MQNEKLIDDLIKENPDVTIRDYLETRDEIEAIHRSMQKYNKIDDLIDKINKTLAA